jgi:hypothetical protein
VFQTVVVNRNPELVAFTSPANATGLFELDPQSEMLLPFEGMGVDTTWELEMPRAANPFDYRTIADVLVTIDYTAFNDFNYRQQVIQSLNTDVGADICFDFRQRLPDQWYDLNNPTSATPTVRFTISPDDFPPNVEDLKMSRLMLYFARAAGVTSEVTVRQLRLDEQAILGATPSDDGVISTRGVSGTPFGEWELAFDDEETKYMLENGMIEDILFVITYSGRTPPWTA